MLNSFQKWKTIPEGRDLEDIKRASAFESALVKFKNRFLKSTVNDPLKELNEDAEAKKKSVINLLQWTTLSGLQKSMIVWHKEAKLLSDAVKVRTLFRFFFNLDESARAGISPVMDTKDELKKR